MKIKLEDLSLKKPLSDDEIRQRERVIFQSRHLILTSPGSFISYEVPYIEYDDKKYLIVNGMPLTGEQALRMIEYGEKIGIERFENECCRSLRSNVREFLLECLRSRLSDN